MNFTRLLDLLINQDAVIEMKLSNYWAEGEKIPNHLVMALQGSELLEENTFTFASYRFNRFFRSLILRDQPIKVKVDLESKGQQEGVVTMHSFHTIEGSSISHMANIQLLFLVQIGTEVYELPAHKIIKYEGS